MWPSDERVGYVLKMYPRFSETFILNEILALEELGAQLDVFSLRAPADGRFHERLADVDAPVTYLPHRLRPVELWDLLAVAAGALPDLPRHLDELLAVDVDDAAAAVQLAVLVRERGLVHLHAHFGSVATTVARLAARIAGVGYSFTAHAKDIFHCSVEPEDLRRKLSDADAVVTVSDYNAAYLTERFAGAASRVIRVYNGLDLREYPWHDPVGRPPVVAAVGRLVEKKGFHHLVDAIALLARRGRRVRLDLVGTGQQQAALEAQVAALGLEDRVRMLGALPQKRVRDVVRGAAVLAAPCVVGADGNRDGLPTVLLEALATGTPCVATPVTGIPEAVRHDETGLLVPEGDASALAEAITALLDDPERARRLSRAGRALVEEKFDIRRNASVLAHRVLRARALEGVAV